ncbi:MAG: right-handed parallel beta-helix repeat-containing protein [Dongiaceae bacterium]
MLVTLSGLLFGLGTSRLRADVTTPALQVATSLTPKTVLLFTTPGAGNQTGTDWKNAMPIGSLQKALKSARPGLGFLIGFDATGFKPAALDQNQFYIRVSGDEKKPVFVQAGLIAGEDAVDAAPMDAAAFFTSAQPWSLADFAKQKGSACFAIANGASHLRLTGFRVDGTPADGFFKFRGKEPTNFSDIVISNIDAKNVGRVIETEHWAMLQNVIVSDCRAVGIVRGFARFRNLSNAEFRNLDLDAANMDAGGKNVCQLISFQAGENVLFENITLRNALNQPPPPEEGKEPGYVQGDGIVCERKTKNVTIRNCQASNMGDGGFDLKTTNVTIEDSSTDSCKFGARIWAVGDNVIRRCEFRNPKSRNGTQGACVQVGGTVQIFDSKLHAGPGTVAVRLHQAKKADAPYALMQGGSIETEGDGAVVGANAAGVLELRDVMVNGVATSHRYVFDKKKEG